MEQTKLSIIIPYYETQDLTLKLVREIMAQKENLPVELILIDDASNGEVFENEVDVYLRNNQNKGGAASRNRGVRHAQGNYITFIDCDDFIYNDYVKVCLELVEEENDLCWLSWTSLYGDAVVKNTEQPNIAPWGCIFKRNILLENPFNETRNIGEEPEFWNEVFKNKELKIGFTKKIVYIYNIREDSATRRFQQGKLSMFRPKVKATIFIPIYNQEDLIIRALESLPVRDDIEILIIDDCSTDNTLQIVTEYKINHPQQYINIIHNEENKGLGYVKNIAYTKAEGEYIGELDSDDYVYTDKFNEVINQLDGSDIVYYNLQVNSGEIMILQAENKNNLCAGINKFMKKNLIGDTKCLEVRAGEDYPFNLEIQNKPHTDKFTNITAYHYNFPREGSLFDQLSKGLI